MTIAVLEHVQGHYEVLAQPYGKVYKWVPAHALIECECGQMLTLQVSIDSCPRCHIDYAEAVRELGYKPLLTEEEAYRSERREYEAWMKDEGSHRRHSEGLYGEGLFSGLAAKDEMNRVLDVLYGS